MERAAAHRQVAVWLLRQEQRDDDLTAKRRRLLVLQHFIDGVQLTGQESKVVQDVGPEWGRHTELLLSYSTGAA